MKVRARAPWLASTPVGLLPAHQASSIGGLFLMGGGPTQASASSPSYVIGWRIARVKRRWRGS